MIPQPLVMTKMTRLTVRAPQKTTATMNLQQVMVQR
jgi:hypothetical protein